MIKKYRYLNAIKRWYSVVQKNMTIYIGISVFSYNPNIQEKDVLKKYFNKWADQHYNVSDAVFDHTDNTLII